MFDTMEKPSQAKPHWVSFRSPLPKNPLTRIELTRTRALTIFRNTYL